MHYEEVMIRTRRIDARGSSAFVCSWLQAQTGIFMVQYATKATAVVKQRCASATIYGSRRTYKCQRLLDSR